MSSLCFIQNDDKFASLSIVSEAPFLRTELPPFPWNPGTCLTSCRPEYTMCNLQSLSDTVVPLLKNAFYALRREHFKAIPDLACNPIRSQIIQAFFDRRCGPGGSTWPRLFAPPLLKRVRTFSTFTETSTRTTTERWRRSASRSSWWSCPTSGPRQST